MTVEDKIAKLDLNDAAQKLRDKIKLGFVELIPDEEWEGMLKAEFKRFVTETSTGHGHYAKAQPSEFSMLCREVLRAKLKEEIAGFVNENRGDFYATQTMGKFVREYLEDNHDQIAKAIVKQVVGAAVQQVIDALPYNS